MSSADDGSGRSGRELFADLYPRLRRVAAVAAPSDLDPDDLLQEALARVLRHSDLGDLDHPEAYLRRTIVNVASNHNRSRGRERRALIRVAHAAGTDADAVDPYPSDLALLDELNTEDRVAVYLADVERRPASEVADALDISTVAVRARLSRARRRLREVLAASAEATFEGGAR